MPLHPVYHHTPWAQLHKDKFFNAGVYYAFTSPMPLFHLHTASAFAESRCCARGYVALNCLTLVTTPICCHPPSSNHQPCVTSCPLVMPDNHQQPPVISRDAGRLTVHRDVHAPGKNDANLIPES